MLRGSTWAGVPYSRLEISHYGSAHGFITQVIEVGYVIDKRLIRAAKVGVASKK